MGCRAESLAARIEEGAAGLAAFAEQLSDTEWGTPMPRDGRTVGVIVHHVASVYPIEIDLARTIASGKPVTGVTWEFVAELNAKHAREQAGVKRADALDLLRRNSQQAADAVSSSWRITRSATVGTTWLESAPRWAGDLLCRAAPNKQVKLTS